MSYEDVYGDCRDGCIQYAIEGGYACDRCAQEMDNETEEEWDQDWIYAQG